MQTSEHDPVFKAVAALLSQETGYPQNLITPATTLFGDIGIDGLDGTDLLEKFADRFGVDMTGYQPVHFGPECLPSWAPLCWIWMWLIALIDRKSTPESRAGLVPILVGELLESARTGRWSVEYE